VHVKPLAPALFGEQGYICGESTELKENKGFREISIGNGVKKSVFESLKNIKNQHNN
jgi:hypothetical protein